MKTSKTPKCRDSGNRQHTTKELMKKFKTKTYDYKTGNNHIKLHYQWHRGGDVEVTLIVIKGPHKYLSGFFAIAPTKEEAVAKLHGFCCQHNNGMVRDVVRLFPWSDVIKKLKAAEKQSATH
jgi:hypothetical protein